MVSLENTREAVDWRVALLSEREKTLERLYARTYPMVLHYVKERKGNGEDAKDLLQEAIILFYEKVVQDKLVLTASATTYLMAVCKNLWRQELDKRNRATSVEATQVEVEPVWIEEEANSPKQDLGQYVAQLGEKCRDILVRFYYFGQRLEQISAEHGYRNVHTATVQKFKCLERLRKAVSHLSIHHFQ